MTSPMGPSFIWSPAEIRRVGDEVTAWIAEYLTALPTEPVFQPVPPELAASMLATPMPEEGESVDAILRRFATEIGPYPFGNGHPRFYGWVNSPPAPIGIFAQSLAAAMNPSVAGGNHSAVWVERQLLEWFTSLIGFPAGSMGLLVSGGSAAAITALAVARHAAAASRGWDVRSAGMQMPARMLVYMTAEAHGCHQKAVELLGLGSAQVRTIPTDDGLRMMPRALDSMLAEDLAAGALPMAVVASAGTVNTGAIDPLDAVADICARHRVWLHVDGAYGAPAVITDEYRAALAPLARADSVGIDAHKWMYVPVDAGVVLVRDARAMRDAFSLVPPYLRIDGDSQGVQGPPWFSEYGMEQTRPFRALKLWMALRYFGVSGYRRMFEHDIALARQLARCVRESDDFELWEPTGLSIVCFRAAPHGAGADTLDALNTRLLAALQLGGAAFLSSTVLRGQYWLRACIVNPLATAADIDALLDTIRSYL
jgi:aromatic-L-amino-acid/L-tryptophan decarboxylase